MRVLIINNYDSFVYNIVQAVQKTGAEVDVVENDRVGRLRDLGVYSSAIVSPGPGNPVNKSDRGDIVDFLSRFEKSILGICFGHQLLAYYLGSGIRRSERVMHGDVDRIEHSGGPLYKGVPRSFKAIRYHSLEIEPSDGVVVDSRSTSDGAVMGFHTPDQRLFGIQFHPESYYSEFGETILGNFLVM